MYKPGTGFAAEMVLTSLEETSKTTLASVICTILIYKRAALLDSNDWETIKVLNNRATKVVQQYHRQTRQSLANRFHLLWVPSTTPASRTYVTNAITAHENHTKHRTGNVHIISALLIAVFYYQTSKLYWPAMGKFDASNSISTTFATAGVCDLMTLKHSHVIHCLQRMFSPVSSWHGHPLLSCC